MHSLLSTYRSIIVICSIGLIISTLEYWVIASSFRPNGAYPWEILRRRSGGWFLSSINGFHEMAVRALLVLRASALLLVLWAPVESYLFSVALGLLIANTVVLRWRACFDEDGSDRMNSVVLLTMLLCAGPLSTPFTLRAGLWFIALQSCLSYIASGLAKLASQSWRHGDALYRILSTKTYGLSVIARPLQDRPMLRVALCWSVMFMEVLFPVSLVLPAVWMWIFLACGVVFHILCGIIMGFNCFIWAFVATYPAIVYVSGEVRRVAGVVPLFQN